MSFLRRQESNNVIGNGYLLDVYPLGTSMTVGVDYFKSIFFRCKLK